MAITQLDLFRATVAHEPHEGFIYKAGFTPDLHERVMTEYGVEGMGQFARKTGSFHPVSVGLKAPADREEPDFSGYFEDEDQPEGSYINGEGVLMVPGSMYHFKRYVSPLRHAETFADIEGFTYPGVEGFTDDHMAAEVEAAHADGKAVVLGIGHMYESSWQIRGYEEFLMDMLLNPEWCEYILDQLMYRNKAKAIAAAKAGVDVLGTGDDVANQNSLMFNIDQWRHFMKPRWAEVYAAAKAIKPDIKVNYHSDGNIETIIPELIEIGVDILNPIQPECMDPVMVKQKYGDRLVLDGTIGTQTVMPFGTPEDVRNTIRAFADKLGRDGAWMIAPTHVLEPEVPMANIKAFFETCAEFGEVI